MTSQDQTDWTIPPACRITEDQLKAILETAVDSQRNWMLLFLGANLGLRVSEVIHLRPASFIPGTGVEVVRRKKDELKSTILEAYDEVFEHVGRYVRSAGLKPNDWLFPGSVGSCYRERKQEGVVVARERICDGGHVSIRQAQKVWDHACTTADLKVKGRGIHTLRHYNGTKFYAATKDLRATQMHLGHSSPSITQKYADVVDMKEKTQKVGISIGTTPWDRKKSSKRSTHGS